MPSTWQPTSYHRTYPSFASYKQAIRLPPFLNHDLLKVTVRLHCYPVESLPMSRPCFRLAGHYLSLSPRSLTIQSHLALLKSCCFCQLDSAKSLYLTSARLYYSLSDDLNDLDSKAQRIGSQDFA